MNKIAAKLTNRQQETFRELIVLSPRDWDGSKSNDEMRKTKFEKIKIKKEERK